MSYRTLAELEADIRYRYDVEGFTARHPQAQIFRLINDAYRSVRDRLTSDGSMLFVVPFEAEQTEIGRTSGLAGLGYPGTLLNLTRVAVQTVYDVHCKVGTNWRKLEHVSFADSLTEFDGEQIGEPRCWCVAGITQETGSSKSDQAINVMVLPCLDTPRYFRILGVPLWTDTTTSTDRLMTDFGLHEYVMAAVGLDLVMRDDDVQLWDKRFAERERVYADLRKRTAHRDPSPMRRVDVRGRRSRW